MKTTIAKIKDLKETLKISKTKKFKGNPRRMTEKQFSLLKEHIDELGDLSGVIYCNINKAYVGGNQRSEIFDNCEIVIIERFEKPTAQKTVAHGHIIYNGEKYTYREVEFTEEEFKKACIVANNDGGSFDWDILANEWDDLKLDEWGLWIPNITKINELEEWKETGTEEFELPDSEIKLVIIFTLEEDREKYVNDNCIELSNKQAGTWTARL